MPENEVDQEVEAIRAISLALQPLDDLCKQRVDPGRSQKVQIAN